LEISNKDIEAVAKSLVYFIITGSSGET